MPQDEVPEPKLAAKSPPTGKIGKLQVTLGGLV